MDSLPNFLTHGAPVRARELYLANLSSSGHFYLLFFSTPFPSEKINTNFNEIALNLQLQALDYSATKIQKALTSSLATQILKFSLEVACVAGAKREGGGGRKKGKGIPLPFFPSSLSPTPFDACYAG